MSRIIGTNLDFNSAAKIINLVDGTNPQDAATVAQLNAAVEGLAWKDSCRVASTANINLAAPGATIDGISMVSGDRFLAKNQTTAAECGIYVWTGAASAATRAPDASTAAELEQAVTTIEEGTSAGSSFRQTSVNFTLGSGSVAWSSFGTGAPSATETTAGIAEIATQAETDTGTDDARMVTPLKLATYSGRKLKHETTVGDGTATQYTVTHNLGTRAVVVSVFRDSGAYDEVICDVEHTTINALTVRFASAPTTNQFRVVTIG